MNKMVDEEICDTGKFIQNLRNEKNLTQGQLGDLIDASFKTISKWENNYSFPELYHQKKLCEIFNITIEELYSGKKDFAKRRRNRRNSIILIAATVFLFLFPIIIVIMFLNFNHLRYANVFYLEVIDSDSIKCEVSGMVVKQAGEYIAYIGNIDLLNYTVEDTNFVSVDFYYGDKTIYHTNKLSNITFKIDKSINLNNVIIKIEITDSKNMDIVYNDELSILVSNLYSDDMPEVRLYNESYLDLENELISMGFEKTDDVVLEKIEKKKNYLKEIKYYNSSGKLTYYERSNDLVKYLTYFFNENIVEVYIDNNKTPVERYTYDFNNGKIFNDFGHAYTLKDILKILEPYINLRNREYDST